MALKDQVDRTGYGFSKFPDSFITIIKKNLADIFSIIGIFIFVIQLIFFAHHQAPVIDEGLYLYKGLLFVSGRYAPFQDYGPLTYQMPLAFVIPGTIQFLFGPGLTVGRYFAVLLSLFTILGLFLTSRRLGNPLLAAGAVYVFVVSPAAAKMYSMALTEGLVACLLIWVMFLTLGEERRLWQLILGSILAGVILMIRIDLLPLVPLLCLYILWSHGWRYAIWTSLACLAPIFVIHALYWPNIIRMWAYWLPPSLAPFLKAWRPPIGAQPSWNPNITVTEKFKSLIEGIRFYYVALIGGLTALILWPRKSTWKSMSQYRTAVFLSALFFSMVVLHMWAAFIQTNDICVYCFPIYISFDACLGVLLVIVTIALWRTSLDRWQKIISGIAIFVLCSLLCYSLIPDQFIVTVMELPVPRVRSMHILPGKAELWGVISNKLSLDLAVLSDIFSVIIPVILGILFCGLFFLLAKYLPRIIKSIPSNASSAAYALILLVIVGVALSPTEWFGNGYHRYDCNANVLQADKLAGKAIKGVIEPGAKIFWRGVSPVSLLYIPEAQIYPAQLDGDYAYKLGGDVDALERYGWWDQSLGLKWIRDADYALVAQKYYTGWIKDTLESGGYEEIHLSSVAYDSSPSSCLAAIAPRIFKKLP